MSITDKVKEFLRLYPNVSTNGAAKSIYRDNPLLFKDVEAARSAVRYVRGSAGKNNLKKIDCEFLTADKIAQKYNLPKAIELNYKPYILTGNRGLIFGDIHIPFHSIQALEAMFETTQDNPYDFILLNGDIMDMYQLSRFDKDPTLTKLTDEIELTKQFIKEIKRIYPKAKIVYKAANHEARLDKVIAQKAPELFGLESVRLNTLLDLYNMGVDYVDQDRYIDISGLSILHGHEVALGGGENIALNLYRKTGVTAICNHFHRTTEYTYTRLGHNVCKTWSIGCLCSLTPQYARANQWNHGFAEYERVDDQMWRIHNRTIRDGRVI